jgi:MEMO1 family protein
MQACVCPHPPLLIPQVGGSHIARVEATDTAMRRLAAAAGERDTVIALSPHAPVYRDAFTIKSSPALWGDFAAFGRPDARQDHANDVELAEAIVQAGSAAGLEIVPVADETIDHGVLVPMHYLRARHVVILSVVAPYAVHRELGRAIRTAVETTGRDALFLASGDMSHRLIRGAPAGYDERGRVFDLRIAELLAAGDFAGLSDLDSDLVGAAGECGLRSLIALGGYLEGDDQITADVLSYEGPFGVGYLVAAFNLEVAP